MQGQSDTLNVDTHVHLLVNKRSPPVWAEIEFTFDVALADGLQVLCIAEHRDSEGYEELLDGLFLNPRFQGAFVTPGVFRLASGLFISAAAEVALEGGGDIGVHASPDVLLQIPKTKSARSGAALLDFIDSLSGEHVVVAHHLYVPGKWPASFDGWAERLDAIELPGKQLEREDDYRRLAAERGKPMVGGGDSHTWIQLGACRTTIEGSADSPFSVQTLKAALRSGKVSVVPTPNAKRFVGLSRLYRQRLEAAASIAAI